MSSSSNSTSNPKHKPTTASIDPATATKRLSNPPKTTFSRSNSTTANNRRLSNNAPSKTNSLNTYGSDELERERAKIQSLKALVAAAEEKEADATAQSAIWRSKANELASTIDRLEAELGEAQELKSQCERLTKEVEKLKTANKEYERAQLQLAEEFESSRVIWTEEEANLRAKLSLANSQLASIQKESSSVADESQGSGTPPASSILRNMPDSSLTSPENAPTAPLQAEVEALKAEKAAIQASMDQALAASEALKAQLADLARVNEQLMDDNESYQIMVGERTLMGGFDIKQLLHVDDDSHEAPTRTVLRSSPQSSSTPSLEGVEEEDEEEEEDPDAAIERAVLESHGNGARTTGAVEAGITATPKPKRTPNLRKETDGVGLDLAAELAQAEDVQVQEGRRKAILQERINRKQINKDKDQEIKTLKDTTKVLKLYISQILDRIAAHEDFEKILSSDYVDTKSPQSQVAQITATGNGAQSSKAIATKSTSAANPAPKRSSWFTFFTGAKSPQAPSNIKPLRLGTGTSTVPGPSLTSAGLSTASTGIKEQPEKEESDEESRARERKLAEMKLHGLSSGTGPTTSEACNNSSVRSNRRSTSMYGAASLPTAFTLDQNRRNSGGAGKLPANNNSADPSLTTALTPAALLKRNEEREKESKLNLEKGQASGFTEIEIRGHRMRPSTNRQSTAPAGTLSPGYNNPLSPGQFPHKSPSSSSPHAAPNATATNITTGIKDLKMTADLNNSNPSNDPANESIFARTARRISMMSSAK